MNPARKKVLQSDRRGRTFTLVLFLEWVHSLPKCMRRSLRRDFCVDKSYAHVELALKWPTKLNCLTVRCQRTDHGGNLVYTELGMVLEWDGRSWEEFGKEEVRHDGPTKRCICETQREVWRRKQP